MGSPFLVIWVNCDVLTGGFMWGIALVKSALGSGLPAELWRPTGPRLPAMALETISQMRVSMVIVEEGCVGGRAHAKMMGHTLLHLRRVMVAGTLPPREGWTLGQCHEYKTLS